MVAACFDIDIVHTGEMICQSDSYLTEFFMVVLHIVPHSCAVSQITITLYANHGNASTVGAVQAAIKLAHTYRKSSLFFNSPTLLKLSVYVLKLSADLICFRRIIG